MIISLSFLFIFYFFSLFLFLFFIYLLSLIFCYLFIFFYFLFFQDVVRLRGRHQAFFLKRSGCDVRTRSGVPLESLPHLLVFLVGGIISAFRSLEYDSSRWLQCQADGK